MNIAIIPARGGSKRIPRKNIKLFIQKPIIAYSIIAAINSKIFDKIIVSTEDDEIAEVSKKYGAEIPFIRPTNLADDHTPTIDVINHSIRHLKKNNLKPELVCCIYPTAPFINIKDIINGYEKIKNYQWSFVFSAAETPTQIFRSFENNFKEGIKMFFPNNYFKRTQDLPKAYFDAGQFYWGRTSSWLEKKEIFNEKSSIIEIPRWKAQDIDTIKDWKNAEIIMENLYDNL